MGSTIGLAGVDGVIIGRVRIPQRVIMVLILFLCTMVAYMERTGFSIAFSSAATAGNLPQSIKGGVLSAFYYGYVFSQIPGGWAAARYGGRRVLTPSFLVWAIVSIVTPIRADCVPVILVSRVVIGAAQGVVFPSIHTVLAQWIPKHERSRAVSLTTSGMYFGSAVSMLILPTVVSAISPTAVPRLVGALGLIWIGLWLWLSVEAQGEHSTADHKDHLPPGIGRQDYSSKDGHKEGHHRHTMAMDRIPPEMAAVDAQELPPRASSMIPWRALASSAPVWAIVVNNFVFHYAFYVVMNWMPTYFEQGLGVDLADIGWFKMVPYFAMFVMANVGGVLGDYMIMHTRTSISATRKILNTVGFVGAAAALLLLPLARSVSAGLFYATLTLALCSLARGGFAVNHMDIAPRFAGIVMGLSNTAGTLAGVIGVAVTGLQLDAASRAAGGTKSVAEGGQMVGWMGVFLVPAILNVISAVVFVVFGKGHKIFT
eukprot:jgi/Mesvir1/23553/Mv18250-RA.1